MAPPGPYCDGVRADLHDAAATSPRQRTGPAGNDGQAMLVWIAFALLTAAVLAAVLAPLARPAGAEEAEAPAEAGTLAVYRDQLAEIEAERARGVIGPTEAEAARLEISRRLLKSAEHPALRAGGAVPQWAHRRIALGTAVAVPLL